MNTTMMQELVAEKIQLLYRISQDLEKLFSSRHYTSDGRMIGSIGETLADSFYNLNLFTASEETHDAKTPDWSPGRAEGWQYRTAWLP